MHLHEGRLLMDENKDGKLSPVAYGTVMGSLRLGLLAWGE